MERMNDTSLMKHLMDNIKDNIYFMDREGRIILINEAGAQWLGYDFPKDLIGKTDLDIFTNEHGTAAYEDEQRIMETGIPVLGKEEKETWADGHETWVSTSKMPLRNDDGEIVGIFGISRDITDHKKAELRAEKYAEENRQFREEMEDELLMAAELQKTFFPASYPVFPEGSAADDSVVQFSHRHCSGGLVGGDFCSIRKLSETEAGILLCDVMGHGVRAALGTAIVRAMVEEISHQEKDPGGFLEHMNRALMPILRQGDQFLYATACYMVLDVSTGQLQYASAGHPLPIHMSSNDGQVKWLADKDSGPALAIDMDSGYSTLREIILPGDAVIMYTDGIHEVVNDLDEEFGTERLLAVARRHAQSPLQECLPTLLNEARQFAKDAEFDDDVCIVGFQLRELCSG